MRRRGFKRRVGFRRVRRKGLGRLLRPPPHPTRSGTSKGRGTKCYETYLVCCGRSTTTWQLGRPEARSWRTTAGDPAARTTTALLICSAHDHRPPSFTLSRGVQIRPQSRLIIRYGARTTPIIVVQLSSLHSLQSSVRPEDKYLKKKRKKKKN